MPTADPDIEPLPLSPAFLLLSYRRRRYTTTMTTPNATACAIVGLLALVGVSQTCLGKSLRIACVQMHMTNSIETNTDRIEQAIAEEAGRGTRVVVFPECSISGYDPRVVPNIVQEDVDAAVERVRACCRQNNVYAIVGTTWLADGVRTNVALVIDPQGDVACRYTKMHVVESYNRNGNELAYFSIDGVPATLFVCHDERYPELMRIPVLAGAKVAFYISFESAASSGKNFNYRCQIIGRAVENQTWVVACNAPADNECGQSHGQSRIIAPDGTIVREAGAEPQTIRASVDTQLASDAWVRAGAAGPPFDRFWQEGLRVLHSQHPDMFEREPDKPDLLPDRGRFGSCEGAKLRIACVRPAVSDDIAVNADRIIDHLEAKAAGRARVVVFPACALTGIDLAELDMSAVGVAVDRIAQACKRLDLYCIVGSAFRQDTGRVFNGAYVIGPSGKVLDRYAQIHTERPELFGGGERLALFRIDGVRATVLIGHDVHFPELSRTAALGGARICFYIGWDAPARRADTAEAMVVCRAVESQVFTVWCDAGSSSESGGLAGYCRIVHPDGRLAKSGGDPGATFQTVIDTARASYNYPRAGASSPCLAAFWQEALDILWQHNPWLADVDTQRD